MITVMFDHVPATLNDNLTWECPESVIEDLLNSFQISTSPADADPEEKVAKESIEWMGYGEIFYQEPMPEPVKGTVY